jgi:hypothetical protein
VNRCAGTGSCTDENNCSSTAALCVRDCVCDAYASWFNCALTSCWNQIYSCEYQNLAMHAHENCPGAGVGPLNTDDVDGYIPYSPAPANAPGGCSCDISFVYYRHYTATANAKVCEARVTNGSSEAVDRCRCCAASEQVSSFYNTCPSTSPASYPLFNVTIEDSLRLLSTQTCRTALAGFDCRRAGFQKPGISGGNFLTADTLPSNGTQTISNTGNAITSPVSGPTLVWKLGERFPNMTAVAASMTATGSGAQPSSSTTTTAGVNGTKNGAASTREPGGGGIHYVFWVVGMLAVGMAML